MKPPFNSHNSNNKCNGCNGRKPNNCFRCGLEDHFIANFLKPDTLDNEVQRNTEKPKTRAYRSKKINKTLKNSTYKIKAHNIYTSMEHMSYNVEIPRNNYGDNLQLTDWILDSYFTCHTTPEISDFIPSSLAETYK